MGIHQYSLLDHFDWDSFQFEDWNEEWTIDKNRLNLNINIFQ